MEWVHMSHHAAQACVRGACWAVPFVAVGCVLVVTAGSALAPGNPPASRLDGVVTRGCAVLALAIYACLLVRAACVIPGALSGRSGGATRWLTAAFAPAGWRRAILAACGMAVMAAPFAAPGDAGAGGPGHPGGRHGPRLDGLPMPERPSGRAVVVVRDGDSLWSIAAAALPAAARSRQIARTWPRWYVSNAARIGPDPDLIYPGTALRPPTDRTRG
jgi:hypothetical protein